METVGKFEAPLLRVACRWFEVQLAAATAGTELRHRDSSSILSAVSSSRPLSARNTVTRENTADPSSCDGVAASPVAPSSGLAVRIGRVNDSGTLEVLAKEAAASLANLQTSLHRIAVVLGPLNAATLCQELFSHPQGTPSTGILGADSLVVEGVYEGGLTLWQSEHFLAEFLVNQILHSQDVSPLDEARQIKEPKEWRDGTDWNGTLSTLGGAQLLGAEVSPTTIGSDSLHVLELGCGHGIAGISFLVASALHHCRKNPTSSLHIAFTSGPCIVFQDLNYDAVLSATLWNCFLTLRLYLSFEEALDVLLTRCRFIFSSWESLLQSRYDLLGPACKFDMIIASEVTYRTSEFSTLCRVLANCLSLNLSTSVSKAVIASKRYYFGLGGGSQPFIDYLNNNSFKGPLNRIDDSQLVHNSTADAVPEPNPTGLALAANKAFTFRTGKASNFIDILLVQWKTLATSNISQNSSFTEASSG